MEKEEGLKEMKCVVCGNTYDIRTKVTTSRTYKRGRRFDAVCTCSPKCARMYNAMYMHFKYSIKKKTLAEVLKVIDERIKKVHRIINDMKRKYEKRPSGTRKNTYLQYRKVIKQLEELKQKLEGGKD